MIRSKRIQNGLRSSRWLQNDCIKHRPYHNHLEAEAYYVDGEEHIDVTALYVNPLGKWLPDCDYSYESQNQVAMGDIHNLRDDLHAWYMMHDRAC